jgi:predicted nucleic acid-binding protein
MVYVDTSALVPIFIREPASDAVIGWIESGAGRLAISEWSLVEFASATAIKLCTGQVTAKLVEQATAHLREFASKHCMIVTPEREDFRRGAELASDPVLNLRAGDALHLAIAAGMKAAAILCLDQAMNESAKSLGIAVVKL